jgi:strictosidine synthase
MTRARRIGRAALLAIAGLAAIIAGLLAASPVRPAVWAAPSGPPAPSCDAAEGAAELRVRVLATDLPANADGLAFGADGFLRAALADGTVASVDPASGAWRLVAHGAAPGAFLTGLAVTPDGTLWAADERGGALHALREEHGQATGGRVALSALGGRPLRWANDVAAADGLVWLTTSSQRRNLDRFFEELLEHRGSGQLIAFDPASGAARERAGDLLMANGVAPGREPGEILVAETAAYRVKRFAPGAAPPEVVLDNLPGFPGNLRRVEGADPAWWLTLLSPRSPLVDTLAPFPSARRLLALLPAGLRPGPQPLPCILRLQVTEDGAWQARAFRLAMPGGSMPSISTALERGGRLYLSPAGLGGASDRRLFVAESP